MTHYLKNPNATALIAIFEEKGDDMIVSAAEGIIDMRYMDRMTKAEARTYYASLIAKGWQKTTSNLGHSYVWNLYA